MFFTIFRNFFLLLLKYDLTWVIALELLNEIKYMAKIIYIIKGIKALRGYTSIVYSVKFITDLLGKIIGELKKEILEPKKEEILFWLSILRKGAY